MGFFDRSSTCSFNLSGGVISVIVLKHIYANGKKGEEACPNRVTSVIVFVSYFPLNINLSNICIIPSCHN